MNKSIFLEELEFLYTSYIQDGYYNIEGKQREALDLCLWAIDTNYRFNESETILEWLNGYDPLEIVVVNDYLNILYKAKKAFPNHIFIYRDNERIELPTRWFPFNNLEDKSNLIYEELVNKLEFFMTKGKKCKPTTRLNRFNKHIRRLYTQREFDLYELDQVINYGYIKYL